MKDQGIFDELELKKRAGNTPDFPRLNRFSSHFVFVYGTLKKGFGNHQHFLKDTQYMGEGLTEGKFLMSYSSSRGSFPFVQRKDFERQNQIIRATHPIKGEIYAVKPEDFFNLDSLEGNGFLYQREKVNVRFLDQGERGQIVKKCWIYLGMQKNFGDLLPVPPSDSVYGRLFKWGRYVN